MAARDEKKAGAEGAAAPSRPTRTGTVAIVGRPNVGKSTLLNAALGHPLAIVSATPQTTRDAILGIVRHGGAEIALLDTPGIHRPMTQLGRIMNQRARDATKVADVVVFVTDVPVEKGEKGRPRKDGTPRTPAPLTPHRGDVALLANIGESLPTLLVVNKVDRLRQKARLFPLLEALGKLRNFSSVIPISAQREDGVTRMLDEVALLLPEGEPRFAEDDLTDRPTRFFAAEYVREQILRATSEEVPHAAAVSVDRYVEPPAGTTGMVFIDATIHIERPGQKKIIIGEGAAMLKRIGTNARLRIEALVGGRVTLKLWVRVTPGWRESTEQLGELGYGSDSGGSNE